MPAFSANKTSLLLLIFFMNGCAEYNAVSEPPAPPADTSAANYPEADELFAFGANMAKMTAASREEVCLGLLKLQKSGRSSADLPVRLTMGRLLSDACGDIPKILDDVAKTPIADPRLQQMILMDVEALKRMQASTRKAVVIERKAKTLQGGDAKTPKDAKENKDGEAKMLREKLDAIRSMEKRLDESGDTR